MAELKAVLSKCITVAGHLSKRQDFTRYLAALSDQSPEINHDVFRTFACDSSDILLAALYKLDYFKDNKELLRIAGEIVEMREEFGHEEEEAGDLISKLLFDHRGEPGKEMFYLY